MSTTPTVAGKEQINEPRSAAAPKPGNPARPSKFAGLNLRQRSSEQPAAESESTPALQSAAQERAQSHASIEAGPGQLAETPAPAPDRPSAESATSRPLTEASMSSASEAKTSSNDVQAGKARAEHSQQGAMAATVPSKRDAGHSRAGTARMEDVPTRRRGKRTDPEYVQVTAYVRQETYRRARIKLLESTKPQEFSEVVEELLTRWLRSGS